MFNTLLSPFVSVYLHLPPFASAGLFASYSDHMIVDSPSRCVLISIYWCAWPGLVWSGLVWSGLK